MDVYMNRIEYINSQEKIGSIFENILDPVSELKILHDDGFLVESWDSASDENRLEFMDYLDNISLLLGLQLKKVFK